MAVTPTQLTDGTSAGNPAGTAVVSPAAGRLLLLAVAVAKTGAPAPNAGDVAVAGLGLTWELVTSVAYRSRRRLYLLRAQGTPSSGALTITYNGAATYQEMQWALAEWAGAVVGNNGVDALAGAATAVLEAGGTALTVTIGGTPAAGDATAVWFGVEEAGGPPPLEAGWTEVSRRESANVRHLVAAWDAELDQTATITWTSSANGAGGIGAVVLAVAGGDETTAGPLALGLAFGAPAAVADFEVEAASAPLALTFGAPAATAAFTTTAQPFDLGLAFGPLVTQGAGETAAGPFGLGLAFGAPAVAAGFSTTAQPFELGLAFHQNGVGMIPAQPLPAALTVLPDLTVATVLDLATSTDLFDLAVLTDLPALAVLTTVEG